MKQLLTHSDIELINCFQLGNERAFQVLYHRYQQKIFGTIMYYIKDPILAEDLSQEVYIKIITFIKSNRYNEEGRFLSWALQIAYSHCMDHLRKKKRTSYVPDFFNTVLINVAVPSPEVKMMQDQVNSFLPTLVDQLSPEQKKVVYYRYYEEFSFKQIAELTNTSVNTSLGRMRYALMHLRNMTRNHPEVNSNA